MSSDEPFPENNSDRRILVVAVRWVTIVILASGVVSVVFTLAFYQWAMGVHADFSALWATHDLVENYRRTEHHWPSSWTDLETVDSEVLHPSGFDKFDGIRELIDVNFHPDEDSTWFVRVKSGRIAKEEASANERLAELGWSLPTPAAVEE